MDLDSHVLKEAESWNSLCDLLVSTHASVFLPLTWWLLNCLSALLVSCANLFFLVPSLVSFPLFLSP